MAKYHNFDETRPIIRFDAKLYIKYSGNCEWNNTIGVIMQETDNAYLINYNQHEEPSISFTDTNQWFPKSKCTILENIGTCYVFKSKNNERYVFNDKKNYNFFFER